jgi:hypothetical protein
MADTIDQIENDFLEGDLSRLRNRRCPKCGGKLSYSISDNRELIFDPRSGLLRRRCGISIYCVDDCHIMVSHLDGVCPIWALKINDWDTFSRRLYEADPDT